MADAKLTGISRKETLQYLGWLGSPIPDELEDEISRCESRILETARQSGGFSICCRTARWPVRSFGPRGRTCPRF